MFTVNILNFVVRLTFNLLMTSLLAQNQLSWKCPHLQWLHHKHIKVWGTITVRLEYLEAANDWRFQNKLQKKGLKFFFSDLEACLVNLKPP